jgi:hypothetical protein
LYEFVALQIIYFSSFTMIVQDSIVQKVNENPNAGWEATMNPQFSNYSVSVHLERPWSLRNYSVFFLCFLIISLVGSWESERQIVLGPLLYCFVHLYLG